MDPSDKLPIMINVAFTNITRRIGVCLVSPLWLMVVICVMYYKLLLQWKTLLVGFFSILIINLLNYWHLWRVKLSTNVSFLHVLLSRCAYPKGGCITHDFHYTNFHPMNVVQDVISFNQKKSHTQFRDIEPRKHNLNGLREFLGHQPKTNS